MLRKAFAEFALLVLCASVCVAQTATEIRIKLESTTGAPISGALVALVDADNRVLAEGLTSQNGIKTLSANPGRYRVRVRRIGFVPYLSDAVDLPRSPLLLLRVESWQVNLKTVVVSASANCKAMDQDAETLAVVWNEIDKALRASQLTLTDLAGIGHSKVYRKEVGLNGQIVSNEVKIIPVTDHRPFGAVDPAELARAGYVRGDMYKGWEYFGPDEAVLLSPEFANTHCFRLVRDAEHAEQIGVGFEPARGRRIPDIAGTLWLDEQSSELREIVFRYVNSHLPGGYDGGGFTRFQRLPSGAWIVSEWQLQMPRLVISGSGMREHAGSNGYVENGGTLLPLESTEVSTGTVYSLTGTIFDSLAMAPLAGAKVSVDETVTTSDEHGRFSFAGVAPGKHRVSFKHAALSQLALEAIEQEVTVTESTDLLLAIPSLDALWPKICGDKAPHIIGSDRRGILFGNVSAADGSALKNAVLRITTREQARGPSYRELQIATNSEGRYSACGFPQIARGTIAVLDQKRIVAITSFDFANDAILRKDFALDTAQSKSASGKEISIAGIVSDTAGNAVANAYVVESSSARFAVTNEKGEFRIAAVKVGKTFLLAARKIGFVPVDSILDSSPDRMTVRFRMYALARTLDTVRVSARAPGYDEYLDRNGFYRRMQKAPDGSFITAQQIEKRNPNAITHMFEDLPGVRILQGDGRKGSTSYGNVPLGRGRLCALGLVIDGQRIEYKAPSNAQLQPRMQSLVNGRDVGSPIESDSRGATEQFDELVPPSMVGAVEIYPSAASVPVDLQRYVKSCGLVVVWTRYQ